MALHAGGPERLLHAPARYSPPCVLADPGISAAARRPTSHQLHGLRCATRTPFPFTEVLVRAALLRPRRPSATDSFACGNGAAVRRLGGCPPAVRAGRAGALLGRVFPL